MTTTRRGPWLGGLLTLAACLAVLSIVSLARSLVTMKLPAIQVSGLIQRILFGLEVGVQLILATRLLRVSTK